MATTKIPYPSNPEYLRLLKQEDDIHVWFILDNLLPKGEEQKGRIGMTITALAERMGWTLEKIHKAVDGSWLVEYCPQRDVVYPLFRTGIYDPTYFPDARGLEDKLCIAKSTIHGYGCFAKVRMENGRKIRNVYKGILRYQWEIDGWSNEANCYNMEFPLAPGLVAYCPLDSQAQAPVVYKNPFIFYVNQAPRPDMANVIFYTSQQYPWLILLKTTRAIEANEELLVDTYGDSYHF